MPANAPVVDDLYTRALETRDLTRGFVREGEVVEVTATGATLRAHGFRRAGRIGGAEGGTGDGSAAHLPDEDFTGTWRIDLVSDRVFRIRYSEAGDVPANHTPVLAGAVGEHEGRVTSDDERLVFSTDQMRVEVALKPLTVSVADAAGRRVCEVGGREKNLLSHWDAYNTGICRTRDGDPLAVECFALRPGEAVYGFGEQFVDLDKRAQTVDVNMTEATGVTTARSYKNVPFFVTTGGYGVFLNHSARMTAWVGSLSAADLQVAVEDDFLDFFVIVGDVKEVLAAYTGLTGGPGLPPQWSFGFWQSKISYSSADEALAVVRRLREHGVPLDVLHLDTFWFKDDWYCDLEFDAERFSDPKGFMAELAELGVKVSLWQLPYIPEGSTLFDDLAAVDGFVRTAEGDLYDVGICYTPGFEGRVGCIDFTNPDARRVYQDALRRLFDLGARVIKADFGEQAPLDGVYHDGTPGHRMHNLYPLLYNQTVAEVTEEATGERIIWARSAWAGSQRYPLHWGGDSSANWENLAPQLCGGLSMGMSGFPFWSMDIGGFFGTPEPDLLIRSFQAGMFLSHTRIHGTGPRELDAFGDEVLEVCRDALRLRYRMLPYILATARASAAGSLPVARPLVVEFQDDPTTWRVSDQWLFGEHLLVAPVMDPSGRRRVYVPHGTWTDWWTGAAVAGGRWIEVECGLDRIPLWIREGGLVPLGPEMLHVGERPTDEVTVRLAPFAGDGATEITVLVEGGDATVRYVASSGDHRVEIEGPAIDWAVEAWGDGAPEVRLAR